MAERRYRVLAIATHPAQYHAPLFRRMAMRDDLDLHVAYCTLRGVEATHDPGFAATVKWDIPLLDGYAWTHVPNEGSGAESFSGLRNPDLWKVIRAGKFDAVLCYVGYRRASFWIACLAAKLSRAAFLFGTDTTTLTPMDGRVWKRVVKRILWPVLFRIADQVIVPSSGGVDLMGSLGLPEKRVTLTPYVVDNDWWLAESARVNREAVRASWNTSPKDTVFLFCAKLQPWKRPLDLLRAYAQAKIPNAMLVFAGEGPLRGELEAEAARMGVASRVRLLGFANQTQLPPVYTAADLLILPSSYEPFGVVVNEAMLCGCPVAASDRVGTARDLIARGRTGFVYPCGDVDALAAILRQAASDSSKLSEMGEAARARMESWSPRENIEATLAAVARGVSRRTGRPIPPLLEPRHAKTLRMKLLIYSHFFAPSFGGVESAVQSLAEGLAGLGPPQGREFDVTVVTQTACVERGNAANSFRLIRQPSFFQLWRAIRQSDVVHIAGPALSAMALGLLAGRPVVVEHHGYQAICPNGLLVHQPDASICPGHFQAKHYLECWRCRKSEISTLRAWASLLFMFPRRWLSKRAAANISISHHVMERHALPRSCTIYYGIDDPLEKDPILSSAPDGLGKLCFAYVGRFFREKGIAILLRAIAILSKQGYEFEVRLIGDGPQRPELEALIRQNDLSSFVHITGHLTGARLIEAIRDVRVVIMPSICEETAGLAAIEQMIRGRLVIASDVGGLGEVAGAAALKCKPGDADALADRMREVLCEPSLIDFLGQKSRERALELFLRRRMLEEHADIYRAAVRKKGMRAT